MLILPAAALIVVVLSQGVALLHMNTLLRKGVGREKQYQKLIDDLTGAHNLHVSALKRQIAALEHLTTHHGATDGT